LACDCVLVEVALDSAIRCWDVDIAGLEEKNLEEEQGEGVEPFHFFYLPFWEN